MRIKIPNPDHYINPYYDVNSEYEINLFYDVNSDYDFYYSRWIAYIICSVILYS